MKLTIEEGVTAFTVRYVVTRARSEVHMMDAIDCFERSHMKFTVRTPDGRPCAIVGARRKKSWTQVYVITTEYTDEIPLAICKAGRKLINKFHKTFGAIYADDQGDWRVRRLCLASGLKQSPNEPEHYIKE